MSDDSMLYDCLLTFIEWDIFLNTKDDDIIDTCMAIREYGSPTKRSIIVLSCVL